jgi:pimeloyl-ACP methyl ester carboxylesterase
MSDPVPSPTRAGHVDVDGVTLWYTAVGDPASTATPLLILHGAFMHGEAMAPLAARFARERPVILLDQRAHGRSGDSETPLSYPRLGDDAARVVEALGFPRADVLGYSMGGGAALQMAIRHPARVGKLVVLSSTYRRDGWYPEVSDAIGGMTIAAIAGSPLESDYRRLSPTPDHFPRYFERVKTLNFEEQDIPDDAVRAIEAPTMVIAGDADGVQVEHAVALFKLRGGGDRRAAATGVLGGVPTARLLVLPAASHLGLTAMYAEIARHVTAFLNDEPPRMPTWP